MTVDQRRFEDLLNRMAKDARDPAAVCARIETLEGLLERSITLPGTNYRIGLDVVLGLLPAIGDIIAGIMSAYIIWEGRNLGMSKWQLARMAGNTLFDTAVGAVPLIGDAFDVVFRSNTRNLRIIKRYLDRHHPGMMTVDGEVSRRATR
jgi:hypothetical protein